jgi:CxxC motif-containing protein (DUF1111 family)
MNATSTRAAFSCWLVRPALTVLGVGVCVALGAVPDPPTLPFDNQTNGFEDQAAFDQDREAFDETETILKDKVCQRAEEAAAARGKSSKAQADHGTEPACVEGETEGGLGPVYNATSCVSCHQNPVSGSSSQIAEIRAGHFGPDPAHPGRLAFIEHPGGSLVHQRAINPAIQEHVLAEDTNRTLRMSTNILGDGFVECISDIDLILQVANQNPTSFGDLRGTIVLAPVAVTVESSQERVGRFGWKSQHASLLNFAADAYINEMGITSPLQPDENTSNGQPVAGFDPIPDPEDADDDGHPFGEDVEAFTRFMRSTKVPPRDATAAADPDAIAGENLFRDINKTGCAICHVPDWTTMAEHTPIAGNFPNNEVPAALGGKTIHPFSDFLLHDVGTGDGIVQTQHAQLPPMNARDPSKIERLDVPRLLEKIETPTERQTQLKARLEEALTEVRIVPLLRVPGNIRQLRGVPQRLLTGDLVDTAPMIRTAPLWGLRVRPQLLHDGSALTIDEAIRRHGGQAEKVKLNYVFVLTQQERDQLLAFLKSL